MAGPLPQPGWYPDPVEPGWVRWWDGDVWTAHRQLDPEAEPVEDDEPEDIDDDDDLPAFVVRLGEGRTFTPAADPAERADDDAADDDDADEDEDEDEDEMGLAGGDGGDDDDIDVLDRPVAAPHLPPLSPRERRKRARIALGLVVAGIGILVIAFALSRMGGGDRGLADPPAEVTPPGTDWLTYTDPKGWAVSSPPGWNTQVDPATGVVFVFIDPEATQPRRNINVLRTTVAAGMSLDRLAAANRRNIAAIGDDVEILDEGEGLLGNEPAHRFVFERDLNGLRLRLMSAVAVVGQTAYIVTYTADVDRYGAALPDVERVLAAMKPTA